MACCRRPTPTISKLPSFLLQQLPDFNDEPSSGNGSITLCTKSALWLEIVLRREIGYWRENYGIDLAKIVRQVTISQPNPETRRQFN